jgi:predicted PurR-regulated permease PerM
MLNKLPPLKVCVAFAILLSLLVALVVTVPVMGAVLVFAVVVVWCINTLVEHYIK